jgi:DNA modification methylase
LQEYDAEKGVQIDDLFDDCTYQSIQEQYITQKPLKLMNRIIRASSNEGDVCADFFAGSGSFGVAAKKLNRNIILCDINPKAIELSKKRLQSETNLFNCS